MQPIVLYKKQKQNRNSKATNKQTNKKNKKKKTELQTKKTPVFPKKTSCSVCE